MSSTERTYMTVAEAASALHVHPDTVRRWLAQGAPHVRRRRVVRVNIPEITEWLRRGTRSALPHVPPERKDG